MPSRAWVVTYAMLHVSVKDGSFNALSGLSCYKKQFKKLHSMNPFQCPLGLIPHFYNWIRYSINSCNYCVSMPSRAYTSFLPGTIALTPSLRWGVNALSGLYLISTAIWLTDISAFIIVSMPSRAYTSFLRYPFKNLGFMRFPEPVFAGIYQNILTTSVFRAC